MLQALLVIKLILSTVMAHDYLWFSSCPEMECELKGYSGRVKLEELITELATFTLSLLRFRRMRMRVPSALQS